MWFMQEGHYNFGVRRETSVLFVCDDPICQIEIKGNDINRTKFESLDLTGKLHLRWEIYTIDQIYKSKTNHKNINIVPKS